MNQPAVAVVTRDAFELAGAGDDDLDRWAQVEQISISVKVECPKCVPEDALQFRADRITDANRYHRLTKKTTTPL